MRITKSILGILFILKSMWCVCQIPGDTMLLSEYPMRIKVIDYSEPEVFKKVIFATEWVGMVPNVPYFLRNMNFATGTKNLLIDSIQVFDRFDKLLTTRTVDPSGLAIATGYHSDAAEIRAAEKKDAWKTFLFPKGKIELRTSYQVKGRINYPIRLDILLESQFKEKTHLSIFSDQPFISFPSGLTLEGKEKQIIPIRINIPSPQSNATLVLTNHLGDKVYIDIEMEGYDLKSTDFSELPDDASTVLLESRKRVILLSDGHEKLIRLLKNDEVIDYLPYSSIKTEFNFKGFKKGTYWLEAEDLATHQVKYARVKVN